MRAAVNVAALVPLSFFSQERGLRCPEIGRDGAEHSERTERGGRETMGIDWRRGGREGKGKEEGKGK